MAIDAHSTRTPAVQHPEVCSVAGQTARVVATAAITSLTPQRGAPLPSLTSAFSRRAALFGAVTATGFLAAAGAAQLGQADAGTASPTGPGPAAAPDDPIFAAIERHRAANAAHETSLEESADIVDIPDEIEARQKAACDVEIDARHAMHQVVPTTLAGLAAYVAHWEAYVNPPGFKMTELDLVGWEAIPTIAEAMANLLPAGGARG